MIKRSRAKNKKANIKKMTFLVLLLLIAVFTISIAYSVLQASLTTTANKITQSPLSWKVAFATGSINGIASGNNTTISCGTATATASTVTVATSTLSKPEDTCTYPLVINNTGTIDARLDTITPVWPQSTSCTNSGASMTCGNITYKLATNSEGTTLLTNNTILAKQTGSLNVYLIIKYTGTTVSTEEVTQNNGGFTLIYKQS